METYGRWYKMWLDALMKALSECLDKAQHGYFKTDGDWEDFIRDYDNLSLTWTMANDDDFTLDIFDGDVYFVAYGATQDHICEFKFIDGDIVGNIKACISSIKRALPSDYFSFLKEHIGAYSFVFGFDEDDEDYDEDDEDYDEDDEDYDEDDED